MFNHKAEGFLQSVISSTHKKRKSIVRALSLLEKYLKQLTEFCDSKELHKVETVDLVAIEKVQVRLEKIIEFVAQDYAKNSHKMETRVL